MGPIFDIKLALAPADSVIDSIPEMGSSPEIANSPEIAERDLEKGTVNGASPDAPTQVTV